MLELHRYYPGNQDPHKSFTADSVQQQPIAAAEKSESNHGIHRHTQKREPESTSFHVLPGGNSRP